MLGAAAGWLAIHWLKWIAVAASLVATTAAAAWTATPVPSTGRLVDANGQPVAGAVVTAPASSVAAAAEAGSDAHGRYRVGAERWPYTPASLSVRVVGFVPAHTTGGLLVLRRWPLVTGHVVDDTGAAVAGAVVSLTVAGSVVRVVMTDLDGRFGVDVLALGGSAVVAAASDLHDPAVQEVSLAVDRSAIVQLTLARQFAKLHVESDPAGQAPLVDGQPAPDCAATPCDAAVLAGDHQVAFGGDLFVPWQADVQAGKGDTIAVSAKLERKTGTLTVSSPAGELVVDGQSVPGASWSGVVPTGQHTIGFRSPRTWPFFQQVDVRWTQTTQAAVAPSAVGSDPGAFASGLRAYLDAQGGGTYGVYLEELGSGSTIGAGDTTPLEAASVIKMPEAVYLLHQVDSGLVTLGQQVDLHPEDFMSGTGSLYGTAHPGDRYTYQQLLTVLIQQSDNTAWRALRRVLGDAAINGYAASIGAGDCDQVTGWCTARSAGHMMAQLARGRLIGADSTRLLLDLLESTIFNDRINWYLGNVTIAHKVGMDGSVRNDCGVVFLSSNPFAICVFTTVDDVDQGIQVIRDIARAAAWHYGH
ncbi:MAG TPA: serine hydrolase [Candidatus Dormibacteraeota bacterium]